MIDPPTLTADDLCDPGCTVVMNVTLDTHVTGGCLTTVSVTSGTFTDKSFVVITCVTS